MSTAPVRPNFLFIGPDKTGSSWLYEVLAQHPQCYVPTIKDIYFFDRYYERGLDWYLDFFKEAPAAATAVGELSHDYLFSPQVAERIHRDLPGVKLMTCLRNPVERTHSHYLYLIRSGLTRAPFEQALEDFPELVNNSQYARHLKPYFEIFPREDIRVLFFDQLKADSRAFAAQVFDFLDVPFDAAIQYEQQVLPASKPRSYWLARLAKQGAILARDLGMARLVGVIKRGVVKDALYQNYAKDEKPTLDPATAARLKDTFRPDIESLEQLLDVSLDHWK